MKITNRLFVITLLSGHAAFAGIPPSPEQEAISIAQRLKPIADEEWKSIAGDHVTQKYSVAKGDTLYDVSNRLFGDSKYWPKVWALNNPKITNPHHIRPGNLIAFMPGTGTSLPAVAINSMPDVEMESATPSEETTTSESDNEPKAKKTASHKRSNEWRKLPGQRWERIHVQLPPEVDPMGFDRRNKIRFKMKATFRLSSISASKPLEPLGTIAGSSGDNTYLTTGDRVYVKPQGSSIQVGQNYAITEEPTPITSSERKGLSYPILGTVSIKSEHEGVFVGEITESKGLAYRGTVLIPMPPTHEIDQFVAGPSGIKGTIILDHTFSTFAVAQHKSVYIDRGTEDGVTPGMVFRAYQHADPTTSKTVIEGNHLPDADMIVVQACDQFSIALIIRGNGPIYEDSPVILLTDVSDLQRRRRLMEKVLDGTATKQEIDELDQLDNGKGLGKDEERELKQLEKWNGNKKPEAIETPAPKTNDEVLPPPPDAEEPTPPPPPEGAEPPAEDTTAPPMEEDMTAPPPAPDNTAPESTSPPPPQETETPGLDQLLN